MKILRDVSLICTVYNEALTIDAFVDSIRSMSHLPEEIVVVDGGSTDDTVARLERAAASFPVAMRIERRPTFNRAHMKGPVAAGRNEAIRQSRGSIVAVTDAGCILHPEWLAHLTEPLRLKKEVQWVGGWYRPMPDGLFAWAVATVWMVPPERVKSSGIEPSSRSIAFRRSAWATAGGYPEDHIWGEDTIFARRLHDACGPMVFIPEARVYYLLRLSWRSFPRLAFRYATGDGFYGVRRENLLRNVAKLSVSAVLMMLTIMVSWWIAALLFAWIWWLIFRGRVADGLRLRSILAMPLLVVVKWTADASFVFGYAAGRRQRRRRDHWNDSDSGRQAHDHDGSRT